MKPAVAVTELIRLKAQAQGDPRVRSDTPTHTAWKASVDAVMLRALGRESPTLAGFRDVSYYVGVYVGGYDSTAEDARYFANAVSDAVGFIDAAVYELGLHTDPAIEEGDYDAELWAHVRHNVQEGRWEQVASATAIFVEDKVRRWSGRPADGNGRVLVGKDLFGKVLHENGPLALGSQPNETEGWRMLGTGFATALSNVDRHNIQDRGDIKKYALGVLGVGSLLLTQIRHAHPDSIAANE